MTPWFKGPIVLAALAAGLAGARAEECRSFELLFAEGELSKSITLLDWKRREQRYVRACIESAAEPVRVSAVHAPARQDNDSSTMLSGSTPCFEDYVSRLAFVVANYTRAANAVRGRWCADDIPE